MRTIGATRPDSTPPPAKRLSAYEAEVVVLKLARESRPRPVLIGVASLYLGIGWGLREVEALFKELVTKRILRCLSSEELREFGIPEGSEGYVLV